jgi:hypothetical protein
MIWLVRYSKRNSQKEVVTSKVGNFTGGNCAEVVGRVCKKLGLHTPKEYKNGCKCEFVTPMPQKPEELESHLIEISSLDELVDL